MASVSECCGTTIACDASFAIARSVPAPTKLEAVISMATVKERRRMFAITAKGTTGIMPRSEVVTEYHVIMRDADRIPETLSVD